jgi:DNA polymerase III alpha subunit
MSDLPSQAEILQHMEVEKEDETVNATVIGLVTGIRKIQTKTGGMMLMATMESAGFDLRLVIFSRDYDAYVSKVQEDLILIIE